MRLMSVSVSVGVVAIEQNQQALVVRFDHTWDADNCGVWVGFVREIGRVGRQAVQAQKRCPVWGGMLCVGSIAAHVEAEGAHDRASIVGFYRSGVRH
jgi:hypothetical protein